jgi:hypothetical protein
MIGHVLLGGAMMAPEIAERIGEAATGAVDGLARRVAGAMYEEVAGRASKDASGFISLLGAGLSTHLTGLASGASESAVAAVKTALASGLAEGQLTVVPAETLRRLVEIAEGAAAGQDVQELAQRWKR